MDELYCAVFYVIDQQIVHHLVRALLQLIEQG